MFQFIQRSNTFRNYQMLHYRVCMNDGLRLYSCYATHTYIARIDGSHRYVTKQRHFVIALQISNYRIFGKASELNVCSPFYPFETPPCVYAANCDITKALRSSYAASSWFLLGIECVASIWLVI